MIKSLVVVLIILGLIFLFYKLALLDSQHDVEEIMRRLKEEREELEEEIEEVVEEFVEDVKEIFEEEQKCKCEHCHCGDEGHECCGGCHHDADGDR